MDLADDTLAANSGPDMADYYMHHARAADGRWQLAVERANVGRFHVSVLLQDEGWDVAGTLRYWAFTDLALAEARFLELQRIFKELPDDAIMRAVLSALPPADKRGTEDDAV